MATRLLQKALLRPTTTLQAFRAAAVSAVQLQQAPALAPRRSMAHVPLGGKNIFQLRAAAEVAETAVAAAAGNGKQQQEQAAAGGNANPYEGVSLPTSDESEQLLRIRHSVSGPARHGSWRACDCVCSRRLLLLLRARGCLRMVPCARWLWRNRQGDAGKRPPPRSRRTAAHCSRPQRGLVGPNGQLAQAPKRAQRAVCNSAGRRPCHHPAAGGEPRARAAQAPAIRTIPSPQPSAP